MGVFLTFPVREELALGRRGFLKAAPVVEVPRSRRESDDPVLELVQASVRLA